MEGYPIEEIYFYSTKSIAELPSSFRLIRNAQEICNYKKVVIYGAESFKRTQNIICPHQRRFIAGVLYINYFYNSKAVYISPLPAVEVLKRWGKTFIVLDSEAFDFYLNYLERELNLRRVKIRNWYELESVLLKIKDISLPLLLLPDPIFLDERAQLILKGQLKHEKISVINLTGKTLSLPNEISLNFSTKRYLQFIEKVYNENLFKEGVIYYMSEY